MYFLNLTSLLWNESNAVFASRFYVSLLDNSRCFSNKCPWGISFKRFCKVIKVDMLFFNLHGILVEYNLYILFFILENESCKWCFVALWAMMCLLSAQPVTLCSYCYVFLLVLPNSLLLQLNTNVRVMSQFGTFLWPVLLGKMCLFM